MIAILLVFLGFVFGGIGTFILLDVTTSEEEKAMKEMVDIIKSYSYYYSDDQTLWEGALRGIANSLNDPYSSYLSEDEFHAMYASLDEESFAGLGIYLNQNGPFSVIAGIIKDSPASFTVLVFIANCPS